MNNLNNSDINNNQQQYHHMSNQFAFNLGQVNKIKPKQLKKLDIIHLVRTNNIPELKQVLYDLSQENFEENDYFEFKKDEIKLIKSYQILMQYMMNSINHLEEKNQILAEFIDKQLDINEAAEEVIQRQNKKIRNQDEDIDKIIANCKNMEFLIKQLGLEDRIKELGIKPIENEMEDKDLEALRNKFVGNINNNNDNNFNIYNNIGAGGNNK